MTRSLGAADPHFLFIITNTIIINSMRAIEPPPPCSIDSEKSVNKDDDKDEVTCPAAHVDSVDYNSDNGANSRVGRQRKWLFSSILK